MQWSLFQTFTRPTVPAVCEPRALSAWRDPPFLPLGKRFIQCDHRSDLTGFVRAGITALWNLAGR